MRVFFIILAVIAAVLLALVLLLLFLFLIGKARIRIIYREKLKVFLTVLGIRFRILPRKKDRSDPEAAKRRAAKRAKKKKRKRSDIPEGIKPQIPDLLDMIFSLLRIAYRRSRGKVSIRMRCFKLRIATDDAAKTAIVYGNGRRSFRHVPVDPEKIQPH